MMVGILGRGDSRAKAQNIQIYGLLYECVVFREWRSDQARQKIRKGEGSEAEKGGRYQIRGCLKTQPGWQVCASFGWQRGAMRVMEQEKVIRAVLKKRRWQPGAGWVGVSQEMAGLIKRLSQELRQGKGHLNRPGRGVLWLKGASHRVCASALCPVP